MQQDRRHHHRYDVENVRGSLMLNLDASVLNMSLTGMAIETRSMLKVGGNYWLRVPTDSGELKIKADVKWCHLVRTDRGNDGEIAPCFQAGIDFRDILDEKARQVLSFIEDHIIVELDKRLFGRFRVQGGEEVDLDAAVSFLVQKLSLSGMLVELDSLPPRGTLADIELETNGSTIDLRGRIVYVEPEAAGRNGKHYAGIEFVRVTSESRRALEAVIEGLLE